MKFNKIYMENWNRKNTYFHYLENVPCTYSMTVNLDITNFLKQIQNSKNKFFQTILYSISYIVNKHKEFRMDLDNQNNIGYYDICNPCFTVFHSKFETFTNVWIEYSDNFNKFVENYNEDMSKYKNDAKQSKPLTNKNIFNVSCIPWTSFTAFNLNLKKGDNYFLPIFTIGKHFKDGEKTLLPFAVQVNHAVTVFMFQDL